VSYEIECATSFTGTQLPPGLNINLRDCISYCDYANRLAAMAATPPCMGVTFVDINSGQGGSNNCFRYSTLQCATRGNATFMSARLLWSGYPNMTDYNSGFNC
jgi:hypothetical protein